MTKSILDYLNYSAKQYPDKVGFVDEHGSITFSQFRLSARSVAATLLMHLPTHTRRRPIVVMLDKVTDCLIGCIGVTYSGNIYCPFDVHAPSDRLNLIMNVLDPVMVITDEAHFEASCQLNIDSSKILCIDSIKNTLIPDEYIALLQDIEHSMIDTDPLYIICTSGSTGIPKGVVISHRAVIDFTEEASEVMHFSPKETFANQAPFYFDASVPDIYCTLRNAATLHIIPHKMFSFPIRLLEYIAEHQVNAIFWVPSALILVANLRALGEVDISCLKKVMFCGEVMPTKQLNMWRKHLPSATYVNYYGPSETTYASTYYIVDREFTNDETLPIGTAALNTGIVILNESDMPIGTDEIGELCIKGSGLANGYYNNPKKTSEVFVQNPLNSAFREIIYRTGDLVRLNEYGEIEYVCRKDFQIKHQGYRIELGEVETAAMSMPEVQRVCSLYSDKRKEIVLIYEGKPLIEDMLEYLKHKLPDYMVPGRYIVIDCMPMNANGKIDRVKLKELYS